MNDNRQSRTEDYGLGKIIKYWPLLVCVFTGGAWYQTSKANATIIETVQIKQEDQGQRIAKVEEAILYLTKLVRIEQTHRDDQ